MPFEQLGKVLRVPKQRTLIQRRLIDAAELLRDGDADPELAFQHSVLCQISLPYRDPGAVLFWERTQGDSSLRIEAGTAWCPDYRDWVVLGLPWGPKARLVLAHLNSAAIRTQSPVVDVGDSLTAFVTRLGFTTDGRTIRSIKWQVSALSTARIILAFGSRDRSCQVNTGFIGGFALCRPNELHQRVLWPATVELSSGYFESLQRHAVPLDEIALAALSHSAMALDIYGWLAQRLHRIPKPHRQLVPWVALKEQFGQGYGAMFKFRQVFLVALRQVHIVYPAAKLDVNPKGLMLYTSPPPARLNTRRRSRRGAGAVDGGCSGRATSSSRSRSAQPSSAGFTGSTCYRVRRGSAPRHPRQTAWRRRSLDCWMPPSRFPGSRQR